MIIKDGENSLGIMQGETVRYEGKDGKRYEGRLAKVEDSLLGEIYYITREGICYPRHRAYIIARVEEVGRD